MQSLFISIDPGFDAMKVVANGKIFKFPFNVVETNERNMNDYNLRDDFLLYKDENGDTYRVGKYARELVFEQKGREESVGLMEDFYTEKRFTDGAFKIGLRTAVALGLLQNGINPMAPCDIYVMITLPHACRAKYAASVIGAAAGEHHFYLRNGVGKEQEFHFVIQDKNGFTLSQTIAAILGETSDAMGNLNQKKFYYLSNGPTLILDGGYYTMGIVPMSKGGSVDDDKTESNTSFAMRNINMAISDEIKQQRPDIHHYMIEYLLNQNNGLIRFLNNGHAETIDLNKIRKAKQREICAEFIQHLNDKYNSLLDTNYVLVTGGTGFCFYSQMQKYYEKLGIMDNAHMILSSSELAGEIHPIEFAIAIGGYKGLRGKVGQ